MKILNKKVLQIFLSGLLTVGVWSSCSEDFLQQQPLGTYSEEVMSTYRGVEGLFISTYATLDGTRRVWGSGASNWAWGSMRSEEAYKGTEESDQPLLTAVEKYQYSPTMQYFLDKWDATFDGIGQANQVIRFAALAEDIPSEIVRTRIIAEARFIRAHHYFEAIKHWENIPWIDETVTDDFRISNTAGVNIMDKIQADFQYAYDNLPADYTKATLTAISPALESLEGQIGRANKWAAASYLAKSLVFQQKWAEALPLLQTIVNSGVTAKGEKYALMPNFQDNFVASKENNAEQIFSVQYTVGIGTQGSNGNFDNVLNYPHTGGPGGCCGFFQPSHNLANSYKTDVAGLPLLDTYNNDDLTAVDNGGDMFTTDYVGTYDARIDHTIGRVGVPYLDWGPFPKNWVRRPEFGGPYVAKKNVYLQSEAGTTAEAGEWGEVINANNYTIIRFAEVLLWLAEAQIETNDLGGARTNINLVRARANSAETKNALNGSPYLYNTGTYTTDFASQDEARKALRFERKLELAMEGHRFYDLIRWDAAGTLDMVSYLNNEYLAKEIPRRPHLTGAVFEECDKYFPLPEQAVVNSSVGGSATLQQSSCYQ